MTRFYGYSASAVEDRGATPVRIAHRTYLPSSFTARIEDASLGEGVEVVVNVSVAEGGLLVCRRLTIESDMISGALLRRIAIDRLMRVAAATIVDRVDREPTIDELDELVAGTPARKPRAGTPEEAAFLADVASLYREGGAAPTKTVSLRYRVPRGTAARWIQRAREIGALGQALGTKGGEKP